MSWRQICRLRLAAGKYDQAIKRYEDSIKPLGCTKAQVMEKRTFLLLSYYLMAFPRKNMEGLMIFNGQLYAKITKHNARRPRKAPF